jgi:alpha-galactosidase
MDRPIAGISRTDTPLEPRPLQRGFRQGIRLEYRFSGDQGAGVSLIDGWTFEELFTLCGMDEADAAAFGRSAFSHSAFGRTDSDRAEALYTHCGGWQSWSAGWELGPNERLPRKVALIPELLKQTNRDGDSALPFEDSRPQDWLTGHFIIYIRSGDRYFCLASEDGGRLPPVTYRINRSLRRVTAEVFCPGKVFYPGETAAELTLFFAHGYFAFKDTLKELYQQEDAFRRLNFLRGLASGDAAPPSKDALPGGYESWYNRYTNISEAFILEDLDALGKTGNLIKLRYTGRGKPAVFQIDDGWEQAVGDWEADPKRFPRGLAPVAARIEEAGYIPGLWLAPFLVTRSSRTFAERPGWLLRGVNDGEPVAAGYNPHWDKRFYCLDLSRKDVLDCLGKLIEQVIDEWGFRYIKLDFLYAGLLAGDFAEGGSPYEHYERACGILTSRERTLAVQGGGNSSLPVAYLGCGLPLGPSYRHFPLSRIGADTLERWDWPAAKLIGHTGRPGAYVSLMDTIGRSYLDGTVYISDPDVIFLRSKNCRLAEHEKELIALVNFLLGGQIMFSDDPRDLAPGDIALTGRIAGLYDQLAGDEYGAVRIAREVFRLESRSGSITGLINLSKRLFSLEGHEGPLRSALSGAGGFLIDHRVFKGRAAFFRPHTITIRRLVPGAAD